MPKSPADPWEPAILHLRAVDPAWSPIIDRIGPCQLRPRRDHFDTLVRAIIGQQISTKAAASIDARLRALAGGSHHAETLLEFGEEALHGVGLSRVKARYVLNLADAVVSRRVRLHRLNALSDEEIVEQLTSVKGIGRWTAEMFLIFSLNRPDVLPVADLGVRVGLRNHFGLGELPKPRECETLTEPWRPYRTVAMWYLWQGLKTR